MEKRSRCNNTSLGRMARLLPSMCCSRKKRISFKVTATETKLRERTGSTPTEHAPARQWFEFKDVEALPSPALLVYRERVEENLQRMVAMAGGVERLRPHIKTHKMRELIELQLALGITKFKCATIAEAEMAGDAGVPDLLLAYQPVGPNVRRIVELLRAFPKTKFS